jgi:hypothetical protein
MLLEALADSRVLPILFVLLHVLSVFCPLQACDYALRRLELRWGCDKSDAIFRPPCNTQAGPGILKMGLDCRSVHAFTVLLVRLHNMFYSGNINRVIKSRMGGICSVQERKMGNVYKILVGILAGKILRGSPRLAPPYAFPLSRLNLNWSGTEITLTLRMRERGTLLGWLNEEDEMCARRVEEYIVTCRSIAR